ncbi:MAG TPA: hypothetical protein VG650_03775 [Mycobacteriales bacterium]|nr:hypothetical protein [Mycobacteriales bacterium]
MRVRAVGRRAAMAAVAAACVVSCSSAGSAPTSTTSGGTSAAAPEPLHINVADPPERWRTVASFSYGRRADQLGPPGGSTGASGPNGAAGGAEAFPPAAIAVVDNSLWVLDQNKHRVAHFTLSGRYLGEVRGISATARDLAPYPSGRFLVIDSEPQRTVRTFGPASRRASEPRVVAAAGDVARLVPTDTTVGTGPGVPEDGNTFGWSVDLATLDVRMTPAWDREYTFPGGHDVVLDVFSVQVAQQHAYLWLGVAGAGRNALGGELLLELDARGNVASLERVEAPPGDDSQIVRPFYVASDGSVYQWFATPTHAELRVHP